jgi:hypothetical protein
MGLRRVHVPYIDTLLSPFDKAQNSGVASLAEKDGLIGPRCQECSSPVDSEEVVGGTPGRDTWCEVLVKCSHGKPGPKAEELRRFDFASVDWDHRDLMQAMGRHRWFRRDAELVANRIVVPR